MRKSSKNKVGLDFDVVLDCLEILIKDLIKKKDPYVNDFVFHCYLTDVAREKGYNVEEFMKIAKENGGNILTGGGIRFKQHREIYKRLIGE